MRFQIGRAAESFLADVALVRLFASVHQMMFLQVSQLRETFGANVAFERALARMRSQMHLEIGELAERFVANVALVVHFAVLLLQRIGQRTVSATLTARRRASRFRQRSAGRGVTVQRLAVVGTQRGSRSHRRMSRTGVRRRYADSHTAVAAVSVHVEVGRREHLRHVVDVEHVVAVAAARIGLAGMGMRRRTVAAGSAVEVVRLRRLRTGTDESRRKVRMQHRRRGRRRKRGRTALDVA